MRAAKIVQIVEAFTRSLAADLERGCHRRRRRSWCGLVGGGAVWNRSAARARVRVKKMSNALAYCCGFGDRPCCPSLPVARAARCTGGRDRAGGGGGGFGTGCSGGSGHRFVALRNTLGGPLHFLA